MTKTFNCDVDGVVADFVKGTLEHLDYPLRPEDVTEFYINNLLSKEDDEKAKALHNDPEFCLNLPLIPGAKEGIGRLRQLGYRIVWVTSPLESCPGWETARRAWLRKHFHAKKYGDGIIFTSDKDLVPGECFLDDKPKHVKKWKKAWPQGKGMLYDAPYNQGEDLPRVTWQTLI